MNIANVYLNAEATMRFNRWVWGHAAADIDLESVKLEALDAIQEALSIGNAPHYELRAQHSATGRPEIFEVDLDDLIIEENYDD